MSILNFIKFNFEQLKVTNVHVQSANIIFDVPDAQIVEFKTTIASSVV